MLYRQIEEEEYMNMVNEDILDPEQPPMNEIPMMQNPMYQTPMMQCPMYQHQMMQDPMYQNHMMQYQMGPQWMQHMHHMECPMMGGMHTPSTYSPQVKMDEYELEEEISENMDRAPHHDDYHDYDDYDNHDDHDDHDHYYNHGYYPYNYYNPYYQNYYPFYNFNPLLIPLLFGRD
jgi:hypothetical protein